MTNRCLAASFRRCTDPLVNAPRARRLRSLRLTIGACARVCCCRLVRLLATVALHQPPLGPLYLSLVWATTPGQARVATAREVRQCRALPDSQTLLTLCVGVSTACHDMNICRGEWWVGCWLSPRLTDTSLHAETVLCQTCCWGAAACTAAPPTTDTGGNTVNWQAGCTAGNVGNGGTCTGTCSGYVCCHPKPAEQLHYGAHERAYQCLSSCSSLCGCVCFTA